MQACQSCFGDSLLPAVCRLSSLQHLRLKTCLAAQGGLLTPLSALTSLTALELEDKGHALQGVGVITSLTGLKSLSVSAADGWPPDASIVVNTLPRNAASMYAAPMCAPMPMHNHGSHASHVHAVTGVERAQRNRVCRAPPAPAAATSQPAGPGSGGCGSQPRGWNGHMGVMGHANEMLHGWLGWGTCVPEVFPNPSQHLRTHPAALTLPCTSGPVSCSSMKRRLWQQLQWRQRS